jgi:membrane protein implicated in regulation of membrane protease activity
LELFGNYIVFWFVLGLVLLVFEVLTPGIITLFFGLGAWLVMLVLAIVDIPTWFQWALFSVSSLLSLMFLRKHVIKWFQGRKAAKKDSLSELMVAERYIGQEVDVLDDINPTRPGPVEFNGTLWQAKTKVPLAKGDRARIVGMEDLVFIVEPIVENL